MWTERKGVHCSQCCPRQALLALPGDLHGGRRTAQCFPMGLLCHSNLDSMLKLEVDVEGLKMGDCNWSVFKFILTLASLFYST